jgi:hypothetical protein
MLTVGSSLKGAIVSRIM